MSFLKAHGRTALVLAALLCSGCAASTAVHHGRDAELSQDFDRAVVEYSKALRLDPHDGDARAGLERAKVRASEQHFEKGRRFAAVGKYDQALVEYEMAAELSPGSGRIDDELRDTRNKLRARIAVAREGKTELQTLIERTRDLPPPGLDLPPDVKMPSSLMFSDAGSRMVFLAIARFGGISVVFDPTFRDQNITVDLRNATLQSALDTVASATRTFFRVSAPQVVVVVPDTPAKRREYEEEIVRTFYLSNADLKETMDLLRLVLDARRISATTATNALTIKDTAEHVAAAARVIAAVDKARPEVIIDVELMEVDRSQLLEYGLQLASPGSQGLNGSITINGGANNTLTLQQLKNLSASDVLLANLPGIYYRLLRSDSNTRIMANPQLRTADGSTAQARFGDQVPIPNTTFAPIATGGIAQQPIVSYQYQNIGVNIDITPRTHHDDDVTLKLRVQVSSISGSGFGGLPTFGNREINTEIRLRDGETNLLAGLIRDDERKIIDGVPGLSDIPGIGKMFTHTTKNIEQTDIVLTLTPHIIRVLDLNETDLRAFRVGRDSVAPLSELPLPIQLPDVNRPPETPAPAPPQAPPQTTPTPTIPTPPANPPATTPRPGPGPASIPGAN